MPIVTAGPCDCGTTRDLTDHVVEAGGAWTDKPGSRRADLLRLQDDDDVVILRGPLDVNVAVYAEDALQGASGGVTATRQPLASHDVTVAAGTTWRYDMERLRGFGGNAGCSAWIRVARPRPEPGPVAAADLPCDYAVRPLADSGAFFPSPCEPCEGGPVRVGPIDCGPAVDVVPARGGCVRPRYFNGMSLAREDLEAEQRYMRMKLRLHNRAAGTGVVWGFDVALRGEHVVVGPGYGVDCCGNDVTLTCDYAVPAEALLRDPAVCRSERSCFALLLEYVECPQDPRPVHGNGCEPRTAGCEMSRLRETARLRLVPPVFAAPDPLSRFLAQLEDLRDTAAPKQQPVPVAGAGIVVAPDDVAVPFSIAVTLGAEQDLRPDRTQVVTGSIDPAPPKGLIAVRVRPDTGAALAGTVRRDDGTAVAAVTQTGAAWTTAYGGNALDFTYVVDWSTTAPDVLRGQTVLHLAVTRGDPVVGEIADIASDRLYTRWPDGTAPVAGQEVFVGDPGGASVASRVVEVLNDLVVVANPPNSGATVHGRVFYGGSASLAIEVQPTRILMEQRAPRLPCCAPGCCDDRERQAREDRLRGLLAGLLYGRIVQRNAVLPAETQGRGVLVLLQRFLQVPVERLADLEAAAVALYRAWCGTGVYAGPAHCDPDGVVIGCARVQAGALCDIDPADGRRWVVHQPLLDHWAAAFGLDPLDRRVGDLFRRLCCLSHLPGFGTLTEAATPEQRVAASPALNAFLAGPAATELTAATLGGLATVGELDLPAIAALVEQLLCASAARTGVTLDAERPRTFVAEAFSDLPVNAQPRMEVRETARDLARTVLAAIPADAAVGEDNPLAPVLDSMGVRTLADVIAAPQDAVADAAVAVAAPEQVDEGLARATDQARKVVGAVAAAVKEGLDAPAGLEDEAVVRKLAGGIAERLKAEDVTVDADALTEALLARRS